ncbi:MAG: hypothetical protein JWQ38_3740 [Flavipsychrobacter sp.]|nr:hypothetical protein [Flavipsychrobacter sp.]
MPKLELNKEYLEKDEAKNTELITQILIEQEKKKYDPDKVLRIFHPQTHGTVKGEFYVHDDIPEHLKVGLFKKAGTYQAYMRFSNGNDRLQSDAKKGFRGIAIKLLNVPGEKLMVTKGDQAQDFLLFSTPTITPKNVEDNLGGISSVYGGKLKLMGFLMNPKHWYIVKNSILKPTHCPNILEIPFYSTTPYQYGTVGTVKYAMVPREPAVCKMPAKPSETFIRERLAEDLKVKEVWYDFKIQFQTDADKMPMEDTSVEWKSPFTTIGSVRIFQQSVGDPATFTFEEQLVYNIWHSLPEHKPMGGVNRSRKAVYDQLAKYRLERDRAATQANTDAKYIKKK